MNKRNNVDYIYDYNYDYNYRESLMNQIKVNKRTDKSPNTLKYYNYHNDNNNINSKDNLYYSIEKKTKIQKNKIPLSLNKKNMNKVSKEKTKKIVKNNNNIDKFKKTINTYSNENRIKDGNIIEELQNNKYLRPMLCASNINKKLLKCRIEEPIKNIYTLSLKKYINNNIELPFEKIKSPEKINNNDDICDAKTINYYNLNNKTSNRNILKSNNYFSPNKEIVSIGEKKNNNSFMDKDNSFSLSNYLSKYSINNMKKYSASQLRMQKKKDFFSEERKEKKDKDKDNLSKNEIYYKNAIIFNSPINNKLRNNNNHKYFEKNNTLEIKNKKNSKENKLLQIYKSKLVEEFIIVLNKFISNYLNKNRKIFFNNFMMYKNESKSNHKIYFKKKNKYIKKKQKTSNYKNNKLLLNIEKEKNKAKVTTDTSTNFNLNNKSFSNDIKSSSLSNNILSNLFVSNNYRINNYNQSSSFLLTEQKHKNYSQSPEDSLYKYPIPQIKTKTIIYKKKNSGSQNKNLNNKQKDGFVYKKKSLNNDNNYMNKINSIDSYNINSNNNISNNYNSSNINSNKKGKIIDIDINLGKPVKIINDHSPLEELFLENNEPILFKLNTISSKFTNKNKKKNKAKSGSKNKIKLPLGLKRFAEEDEKEYELINNFYADSYSPYSTAKEYKSNNLINLKTENNRNAFNINNINRDLNDEDQEYIIEDNKLYIRNKNFYFNYNNNTNNKKFKSLIIEKNIPAILPYDYQKNEINEIKTQKCKKDFVPLDKKITKRKVNKLYINCTRFFINILNKFIKKKVFIMIKRLKKHH